MTLSEEDRAALKEIGIDDWYPLHLLDAVDRAIAAELHALRGIADAERLAARLRRYRRIGLP